MHHKVQQTQQKQPIKRRDCPAVFNVCAVPPAVLCAILGLTIYQGQKVFECIQRGAIKVVKGLEGMFREERLMILILSNLEKRKLRCNYIALYSLLRRGSGEGGAQFFYLGTSDRTCGNIPKLHQERIRLDRRKHFFTDRVVKNQHISQRCGLCSNLSDFKGYLDNDINNMF